MSSVRCLILRDETTLGYSVWHATADVIGGATLARLDATGAHIKELARAVLIQRGEAVPDENDVERATALAEATSAL